ncbi:MAG: PrpF domain-containing protein [Thermodesulfobacteriota bacterium]|jgi:2-methylaconitate cis-trans-isomerase PrpF
MSEFRKIPCVIQRGGTSKGVYLHERDLPKDPELRNKVILAIFGSPDRRQIDGLGGADPLTSKCAIIGPSERPDADINYTMVQVDISAPVLDFKGNCGNISSGVGPFAIDEGLVPVKEPETIVRIYNTNTKKILKAYVQTSQGKTKYTGDYGIDGVPGTNSKILLDYSATGGTLTGRVLPTGNPVDLISVPSIGTFEISFVDAGNPTCFIKPDVLGFSGIEGPLDQKVLDSLNKIELIRGAAAKMLGLVDDPAEARVKSPTLPMLAVVSQPIGYTSFADGSQVKADEIDFVSRLFFMQEMHKTYPGTGTVCTGAAALIEGTLVSRVCSPRAWKEKMVRIGHPSGTISIEVNVSNTMDGPELKLAAFGRTSRRIMEGFVYVPESLFEKR